jgi:HK97 gp10 family phage protein
MSFKILPGAGNTVFEVKVKNLSKDFKNGIRKAFYFAGKDFKATANEEIKRKKTGTVYKYKGRKIAAGAAFDYPANRSGANRRSIDFKVEGYDTLEFGAGTNYSPYLEQGTGKMKPRPFLKPSIKKNEQKLCGHLRNKIGNAISGI